MPSVFVLMPFDAEFNPVYSDFLKPVLEANGIDVIRADNIESQQSILKDVIQGISTNDLIIADLTGSNPNVYYELGIAHALKKPVVHLTQSIEEVPFDLKSYRLIEYSTHFAEIEKAREQLTAYAKRFLDGTLQVGNPVTDFSPNSDEEGLSSDGVNPPSKLALEDSASENQEDTGEIGFLDHLIVVDNGYSRIAEIAQGLTANLGGVTNHMVDAAEDLNRISANPNNSSATAARTVCRRLADRIGRFNKELKPANVEFTQIVQDTQDSLESIVSFQLANIDATSPEVVEHFEELRQLQETAADARESFLGLADEMDATPRMERRLNRELDAGSAEIRVMASSLDKIIASISRALNKFE